MVPLSYTALSLVLCILPTVYGGGGNNWTYDGTLGPSHWYVDFPECNGHNQSPIDVDTAHVELDEKLTPFDLSDFAKTNNVHMLLENVQGHTVEVEVSGEEQFVKGGGLPDTYQLKQFHFHWGKRDERGSEHKVNGMQFPMEMHIVLYSTLYPDIKTAISKPQGLAVLAFFFEVGAHNNHFDNILNFFDDIAHSDDKKNVSTFRLISLLPRHPTSFYRYEGSLTTPPCSESVIWTLFREKIEVSEEQLERFRHIKRNHVGEREDDLVDDFRPIQKLNNRTIYTNDKNAIYSTCTASGIGWTWVLLFISVYQIFEIFIF